MTSQTFSTMLQRRWPWSNTRRAWQQRLILVLALAGTGAVYLISGQLALAGQIALWAAWLVTLALMLRQGWLTLLGPVLPFDLVRTTRRSRYLLYRIYAYAVLILVMLFYVSWYLRVREGVFEPNKEAVRFGYYLFISFMCLQVGVVGLVTPAYIGGVIAEEKDRRTLEYLLATDLDSREIILGRLGGRLANLFLMLLTGLPIMSFVEFLGGVDPELVLLGFVVTALTMISLAGIAVLTSVLARRPREAILLTYLIVGAYLLVSSMSRWIYASRFATMTFGWGPVIVTGGDLLHWFTAGNPLEHFLQILQGTVVGGGSVAGSVAAALRDYAVFHLTVGLVSLSLAVMRLRPVFLKQASTATVRSDKRRVWRRSRVGRWPMIWKEVTIERGVQLPFWGRVLRTLLVLSLFVPLGFILYYSTDHEKLANAFNVWSRSAGSLMACLLLVGVAIHASTAITAERERQTLDGLLTTPLDSTAILLGKWLGSILSALRGWVWLGVIWGIGVVWGGMHPLSLPLMAGAWLVYAALLATLGLWFSLLSRSSLRATAYTVLATTALGIGFLALPIYALFPSGSVYDQLVEWVTRIQLGLTPAVVFGRFLPFTQRNAAYLNVHPETWEFGMAMLGLALWALAALVLWAFLSYRFRKQTGRQAIRRPEQVPSDAERVVKLIGQTSSL
jgi:ABC-type transport system involved in multi-copper enzyme maturation permease subunit